MADTETGIQYEYFVSVSVFLNLYMYLLFKFINVKVVDNTMFREM